MSNILVWDTASCVNHAIRFAEDGNDVCYFTNWHKETPEFVDYATGVGFNGIKKIKDFFGHLDWADLVVFLYNTAGGLCHYLRENGYLVYGAGLGEKLELDRAFLKKIQKEIGLPVQNYKLITGVDNAIEYIKTNPDKFVKVSTYRGDLESFHAKDASIAEDILNAFRMRIGPFDKTFQFMIEDKIDSIVESGWDLFFNGEDYLRPYMWGFLFDNCYFGKWSEELPAPLKETADKLKPVLKKFGYKGAISCEVMLTKEGKGYLLDLTCRSPMPLSLIWDEGIDNFTEVFEACAEGKDTAIEPNSDYAGIIDVKSHYNEKNWLPVALPNGNSNIKILSGAKVDGKIYSVPPSLISLGCLGYGDTLDECVEEVIANSDEIEIYDGDVPNLDKDKLEETIKKAKTVGLDF